ncbi:MAG: hypothetical protein HY247_05250 [archaeon]|nr:MAG: hypothetical protein HY247_05250 [archaeon]
MNRPSPEKAREVRSFLLPAARSGRTVTYGDLMKRHNLSRGRALSRMIGTVDRAEIKKRAPGFAAIIVRKDTGFPGGGFFCDDDLPRGLVRDRRKSSDPRLTAAERDYVRVQQKRIWSFYGSKRRATQP